MPTTLPRVRLKIPRTESEMAFRRKNGNPTRGWFEKGCYRKCGGKIVYQKMCYLDFLSALVAARSVAAKGHLRNSINVTAYHCDLCGWAHVGRVARGTVLMYGGWRYVVGEVNDDG